MQEDWIPFRSEHHESASIVISLVPTDFRKDRTDVDTIKKRLKQSQIVSTRRRSVAIAVKAKIFIPRGLGILDCYSQVHF